MGTPKSSKSHNNRRRKDRSLNAFAIAEKQLPSSSGISRARLNELDQRPLKRQRTDEGDSDTQAAEVDRSRKLRRQESGGDKEENVEMHSDSEGNEWKIGEVDSEEDSDIDSDDALGESDEERFEGFTFGGSSSRGDQKRAKPVRSGTSTQVRSGSGEIDLNEAEVGDDGNEESDGLGEDAIDLADVLDQDSEDEDEEEDYADENVSLEQESSGSELSFSEDDDEANPEKLSSLRKLVADLEDTPGGRSTANRLPSAHESMTPSEFALPTKNKLTIADLLPSVTDPKLRKSLKVLSNSSVKPSSKRSGIPGKLDVPLPQRQQDKLDRAAAYDKAKETLNRWVDTVKQNRRAEYLSFPLHDPNASVPQGKDKLLPVVSSRSVGSLETTIQIILQESGLAPGSLKDEREEFAELQANNPSLEEIQTRRADLRRARDLLFREGRRAKRIKKIKSKAYRKIHRRDRERLNLRDIENNAVNGVDNSDDEKERNDRRRAEERMGQRHRESRWAKGMKHSGRSTWDEDARNGMQEMARRGEELKKRIQGKDVAKDDSDLTSGSDDDDEYSEDDDHDEKTQQRSLMASLSKVDREDGHLTEKAHVKSSLHNMEFMRKADAAQRAMNDDAVKDLKKTLAGESASSEEEEDASEGLGRRTYGLEAEAKTQEKKKKHKRDKGEFEEGIASDEEQDGVRDQGEAHPKTVEAGRAVLKGDGPKVNPFKTEQTAISRQHLQKSVDSEADPGREDSRPLKPHSALKKGRTTEASLITAISSEFEQSKLSVLPSAGGSFGTIAQSKAIPSPPSLGLSLESSDASDTDDESPKTPSNPSATNKDALTRAFAGDDVQLAFEAEKKALTEEEGAQTEDTTLPGWGRWAGPALSKKDKIFNNRKRFITTVPGVVDADKRRDRKLDKVIINERRQKKSGKYLASQLPHPFETKGQYERSLRIPMGPEWGTKETFQGMTKPRVMVKQGVIHAMEKPMV